MLIKKLAMVRALLDGADGILIEKQNNFSWLTGGRGFIGLASVDACAQILVTRERAYLISPNIEAARLATEECPGLEPVEYPWTEESRRTALISALAPAGAATDSQLGAEFFALRTRLLPEEKALMEKDGPLAAKSLEDAVRGLTPGMAEFCLAGEIARNLWKAGMEPITILIAFDERILQYRHPLPTAKLFRKNALAAICARRHGLIYSVTRCAQIGPLSDEIRRKQEAVLNVDAALIHAARPGVSLESLYQTACDAYRAQGFAEEIQRHHQGGLTGYVAREKKIQPGETHAVSAGEAYAFNPSITGVKSEDTILIGGEKNEILTMTGQWPVLEAGGLARPDILIL